ncbi:MAG: thioredoxin domain-containing protein [Ruminococcus sp.]|nr:thioredoxin domain-containing protein [Oscillospiraceae bacterium]MDY4414281.1 thioredoxin domain-containing protein [Ruminococcus sp.]
MAVRVNSENFSEEVLKADGIVLVDFYSDSCIPCKKISPVLSEAEEAYPDKLKIAKVNVNFDSEIALQYDVQATPTLIFFRDGKEQSRLRGSVGKSEINDIISSLL